MLQVLKKGTTLEQVERAFRMTKDAGIDTLGYFMIGSPTETREEILETIRFARRLPADYVHITILTPFPATEVYFDGLRHGVIKKDFWREFARNPTPDFEPEYWEENLRKEELFTLLEYAYKSFYTRPGYVMKALFRVRSLPELIRKAHAGIKIWQMNANGARSLNEI
jgi:radical SAM superfamily enzyme YgiQ (UPF0313 family)